MGSRRITPSREFRFSTRKRMPPSLFRSLAETLAWWCGSLARPLHRTGSGGNRKKSKLIFDSLQTRDRRGWLKNGNQPGDPQVAPRCGAKTRRGNGCQVPAMPNGRCRMHGGTSTGPRTAEGLERCRTAKLKHGWYGKAEAARKEANPRTKIFWTSRRRRLAWKPTCLNAGRFFNSLPMPKSRVLFLNPA